MAHDITPDLWTNVLDLTGQYINFTLSLKREGFKTFKPKGQINIQQACRSLANPLTTGVHRLFIMVKKGITQQLQHVSECVMVNNIYETTIEVDCSEGKILKNACV